MPYSPSVKHLAYTLDPDCWVSYSGASIAHKRRMDERRTAALLKAEQTLQEKSPMMHPFKAKMLIHFALPSNRYSFIGCLAPLKNRDARRNRLKLYNKLATELINEGMIRFDPRQAYDYEATEKGKVWVDAALSTPLPVRAQPVWSVPV